MASVTLVESAKLALNQLVSGIIETTITVDRFFQILPFDGISGNALAYNRENVAGDVAFEGVGDTVGATAAATFTLVTSSLTTLIGQAEVNKMIQSTRSGYGNDQAAVQIASKSKTMGRTYRDTLINGDGTADTFTGLLALCAAGQKTTPSTDGDALSFALLDELLDLVVDKDGEVDYIQMHSRTLRSYFALLRALGGASIGDTVMLPGGGTVPAYRGVPIFRNDNLPIDQTQGATDTCTSVIAGTLDDGSRSIGIAGLTAENDAGMVLENIGVSQTKDEDLYRVKWYCGLANFSQKGLALIPGITN